jgi:hypothetical protein
METRTAFDPQQLATVTRAVGMAEELVSNHYKMTSSQWLKPKYDVRTLVDLDPGEIIDGPFAQIIRYQGQPREASLSSAVYDFYKICLQDHSILGALDRHPELRLLPFALYIIIHELVHIVRFSKFLQGFDASPEERMAEERRVHERTHAILSAVRLIDLAPVLHFYSDWRQICDNQLDAGPA